VIDEALSVGDVFFMQKCMRFLRKFMERGTVLFVSHDTGAVLNLCETAIWLHKGRIEASGPPKTVAEKYLETLYESQQVPGIAPARKEPDSKPAVNESPGVPADYVSPSGNRNAIELFAFDPSGADFGRRGIDIRAAGLFDAAGNPLSWTGGGEAVSLRVQCCALQSAYSPIVGFMVKDRLGQVIFSDNTYVDYARRPLALATGDEFEARFDFVMPVMPQGDYVVAVAVAEGTQAEHVQHHWIHEAMAFKVHESVICHGLIGIPMTRIELKKR
jgi:lipopolysaccharide transport system ATP-binding protein